MQVLKVGHMKERLARLARWRGTQGFGVQSPSAYRFIRYVVCEQDPYYCYDDLLQRFPNITGQKLRLYRLYFRLSNYAQAVEWIVNGGWTSELDAYVRAGCHCTRLSSAPSSAVGYRVFLMRFMDGWQHFCDEVLGQADESVMLVVEGIHSNRQNSRYWRELEKSEHTGVTFDLYYCGIVFFDRRYFKMNYQANF